MGFNQDFPDLAFCLGGRSLFWGGWSPYLIDSELADPTWPASVRTDLKDKVLPRGSARTTESYLDEAARQIGSDTDNDFIVGALHTAMSERPFTGLTSAPPGLSNDILTGNRGVLNDAKDLEAPLAVQSAPPRPGVFALNEFNGVQLLLRAARAARGEAEAAGSGGPDMTVAVKRLMLVNNTYVTRLERSGNTSTRLWAKSRGGEQPIDVPSSGNVFLALGTYHNRLTPY